jgi:hypothetical protein
MSETRDELLDAVDHACVQCIHMAKHIRAANQHPALSWKLSDRAKRDIEEIDLNAQMALLRIANIRVI